MNENESPMNILYLLPELNVGGVETHVTSLSTGMLKLGHNVTVISNGGALVPRLEKQGIEHITLPVHHKSPLTVRDMAGKVGRLVRDRGIQVVHAHSRVPAWISHFALKRLSAAFIITAHGQYAPHYGSRVMAMGDRIICVSRGILDHMENKLGADPDRMTVVYNGLSIEEAERERANCRPPGEVRNELGIPTGAPVIGSIGRLTNTKGLRYFIESVSRLKKFRPGLKALIVGDGPSRKDLQDRAAELGLQDDIIFTGVRTDVFDILQVLDAYVVASIFEGFPMGCLEAMAGRVPIVATSVGGIPEMVEDGRTALLVRPRDPDSLADKIRNVLDDRPLAGRLTEAAHDDLVKKFSETKMVQDVLRIYYETLRNKKGYIGPVRGTVGTERPRILLTLPELRVGGVETHVIDLATGLKEKGYDPLVVSFGGKLVERLRDADVEHIKLPVHSKSPLVILNMVRPIQQVIRERKIELIHAHSRVPAWICYIARRSMKHKMPFITTCHSTYSVHIGSRVMVWSDAMIAVSDFVLSHMLNNFGTSPEKIRTVHNGVSPSLFDQKRAEEMNRRYRNELGIADKTRVVGMVASLTPRKGYVHFLSAARDIRREFGDVVFLGVGGGPQKEELENKVREYGLDGNFRFLGIRSDVRDLMAMFDVFVLSSSSEGLPYVILEAMCMRKPIVTTDVGGIPEAVKHGENGMLVKPGDREALSRCILELLSDEDFSRSLGESARTAVVQSFNVENMVKKTEDVYLKILG